MTDNSLVVFSSTFEGETESERTIGVSLNPSFRRKTVFVENYSKWVKVEPGSRSVNCD